LTRTKPAARSVLFNARPANPQLAIASHAAATESINQTVAAQKVSSIAAKSTAMPVTLSVFPALVMLTTAHLASSTGSCPPATAQ